MSRLTMLRISTVGRFRRTRRQRPVRLPVPRTLPFAHCRSIAEYRSSLQLRWLQTSVRTSRQGARPRRAFVSRIRAFLLLFSLWLRSPAAAGCNTHPKKPLCALCASVRKISPPKKNSAPLRLCGIRRRTPDPRPRPAPRATRHNFSTLEL